MYASSLSSSCTDFPDSVSICSYQPEAREITHAAAQSVHEYVWRVKWDQGERSGQLGRWNSHPPDRESCLMSGLPTSWHTLCNWPGCSILVSLFKSCLNALGSERGILSLGDAWQETSLVLGLLKKIVEDKKEFIGRSYENCHFQYRNSAVHLLLRRGQYSNNTWNWFHMFRYKRLFSFCYWWCILSALPSSFTTIALSRSSKLHLHIANVNKFWLVDQHRYVYVLGSIEECYRGICPYFSSSVLHV